MLAGLRSTDPSFPGEIAELTLDNAGIILTFSEREDAPDMFQALAVGEALAASLHPLDLAFYEHSLAWFATQQAATATLRLRLRRGQYSWSQVQATFHARPRQSLAVTLVPDDLAKAQREEAKMRWIIEGSAQGVIARTQTTLLYANKSAPKLLGYESVAEMTQLEENGIDDGIHPDDRARVHAATRARLAGVEDVSCHKFRYRRKDGSYIWLEAISRFVEWTGERAEIAWVSDISDRVRAEEELIASKDAAEYANRTKTEFLANMSHELRTPLNAVIGFSEFMTKEIAGPIGSPKYAEYAADIHNSGQHLLSLINDILDLAKLEAGRLDLNESEISGPAVVEACLVIMRPRAQEAGVTVVVHMPPGLPRLRADERAMKQVLFNFLSNAIKFTPQGGCVTISMGEGTNGGLDLVVSDTGIGMSESEIVIALTPFGQVDSKVAKTDRGTGLGFPICDSLMRLHGGALHIQSKPGQGTKMIASFPRERVVKTAA